MNPALMKGRKTPLLPLFDQLAYSLELAEELAPALERCGFAPSDREELRTLFERLKSEHARRLEGLTGAKTLSVLEARARAEAKGFAGLLRSALEDLVVSGRLSPLEREGFKVRGRSFRESTPRLVGWLTGIEVPLGAIAEELSPLLGGIDVRAEHRTRLETLRRLQGEQEVARARLPLGTREVYGLKAALLVGLGRLNRAGRRAFHSEPLQARRFSLHLLARGRKKKDPGARQEA